MLDRLGNLERTHTCGELRLADIGKKAVLMGWVAKKRDFGVFTFIDLRDRDGVTQLVISSESATEAHQKAKRLRGEFVIAAVGEVVARAAETINPKISTGEIELKVTQLYILNEARVPPFQLEVAGSENLAEESLRLKFRYLDLRRPQLQQNIRMRAKAVKAIREYFDSRGFIEIETPILLKSTPEGARDFIVPSRIHRGKFFALPQSPQILKQITMIAGFDKYYQIARCFRDEDLRADRQPEFTQLDMEMSFVRREHVYREIEGMFNYVFKSFGINLPDVWPQLTYNQALERFGSDKPDLRFSMELVDLKDEFAESGFAPFVDTIKTGGTVKCIVVSGGADLSRKHLDEYQQFVRRYGAGGLAWIKLGDEISSSLAKSIGEDKCRSIANAAQAQKGDAVLIVAGRKSIVNAALGALRLEVAKKRNLIDRNRFEVAIITEFPMFEFDEEIGEYLAAHHPFTAPMDEDLDKFKEAVLNPESRHLLGEVRAKAYDAVINGYECAGGSIRIHEKEIQQLNFKALGMSEESARARFGFFLDALEYGTPPHGGFAAGIERLCMVLCGTDNIRDVMVFPKTASAQDLMMDSPGEVDQSQLDELGIMVKAADEADSD